MPFKRALVGQEHQFVFISTFRSSAISDGHEWKKDIRQNMGIINNPKRFNVATTRSKSLLVVFGNPAVLEHDIRWAQYIKMCANYGSTFSVYMFVFLIII